MGVAALNVWYVRPELLDSVGLATMSQSSCLTTPRAKSMHSRCIAPRISAHENAHVTVVGHFPNVAKISEYAKHFRIDFRFDVGLHIGSVR